MGISQIIMSSTAGLVEAFILNHHWFLLTFGFCLPSWYCSKSSLQSDGVRALHLLTWSVQKAFSFRPPRRKINWWYGSVVGPPTERCRYPPRLRTLIFINHACVVHMRTHARTEASSRAHQRGSYLCSLAAGPSPRRQFMICIASRNFCELIRTCGWFQYRKPILRSSFYSVACTFLD